MHITAVIPAYNERDNVVELTERLQESLTEVSDGYTILYVYQGTDGGADQLRSLQSPESNLEIDHYPEPLGVGRGFRIGFEQLPAETTHVLTMDADLNHNPEELPRFLEAKTDADVVVGSRFIDDGDFEDLDSWRKLASPFAAVVLSRLFGVDVNDISSGYRLYDVTVITDILDDLSFDDFEFYPEALIYAAEYDYSISEVPITYEERKHGESKMDELGTAIGYARLLADLAI